MSVDRAIDIVGNAKTFVDALCRHAERRATAPAFTLLADDGATVETLTFAELHRRSASMAARLRSVCAPGDRVLLLMPTGIDYVAAFLGALSAGVIAVPLFAPSQRRHVDRLHSIVDDCRPRAVVVATSDPGAGAARLDASMPWRERGIECLSPRDARPDAPAPPHRCAAEDVALLQYTSGSTGRPKGVMVTHANLMHNARATAIAGRQHGADVSLSWLPLFHDMGLMLGLLQPLYGGCHGILMSPVAFQLRPFRWLDAVSQHRATLSTAPNFAFEHCVRDIDDTELARLDLACWRRAGCGAEPVRADTLRRFAERFGPRGFRAEAFAPAYGLAESTLIVTVARPGAAPRIVDVARDALAVDLRLSPVDGERELVGCGAPVDGLDLAIVDPSTGRRLGEHAIGEIWVHGPSVAAGYWNQPETSRERFEAQLADGDARRWLRTGDMGALVDGELVVNGRLDDMIVLRGRNVFPQDVEPAVTGANAALRPDGAAVFAARAAGGGDDALIVVAEAGRDGHDFTAVVQDVCAAVIGACDIAPGEVVLIRAGTMPRTSSGKVQRRLARTQLQQGRLRVVHRWRAPADHADASPGLPRPQPAPAPGGGIAETELLRWIRERIAGLSGVAPGAVDPDESVARHAIDSLRLAALVPELATLCGRPVALAELWQHGSPRALAHALATPAAAAPPDEGPRRRGGAREALAIIGYACRLPGVPDTDSLWPLLASGRDAITEPAADRPGSRPPGVSLRAGLLDGVDRFDARFFGISPLEAQYMDPQQRLVLELTWEALERAGQSPDELRGSRTGVFVGAASSDYGRLLAARSARHRYAATGTACSVIANRLSYQFDLRGPSLAVDTACSSSLVALHLARQSLLADECDLAIVAGVNLLLDAGLTVVLDEAGMMSPDACCHVFDAQANGYVRGEGCGVVLLRRRADAAQHRDRVVAELLGSAVRQDGRTNGLTAPSGRAQQQTLRAALRDAGVAAADISYVEAHGTGTALGDPIELEALRAVLDTAAQPCLVGSVKAALGHLEAAAGIAGVVKLLAMFEQAAIVPQPNFERLNPRIDLHGSRLGIADSLRPWAPVGRRIAGISSLGFGGSNCHAVLADPGAGAAGNPDAVAAPAACVAVISAPSAAGLQDLARDLASSLDAVSGSLADICFTLAAGRAHHGHRAACVVRDRASLRLALEDLQAAEPPPPVASAPRISIAFGDRAPDAIDAWLAGSPAYARHAAAFDGLPAVVAAGAAPAAAARRLRVLRHQHAVWRLLCEAGLAPDSACGNGCGERAAAVASGALDIDAAVALALGDAPPATPPCVDAAATPPLQVRFGPIGDQAPVACVDWADDAGPDGFLELLAQAYRLGAAPDWACLFADPTLRRVVLPGRRFERERHWAAELDAPVAAVAGAAPVAALLSAAQLQAAAAGVHRADLDTARAHHSRLNGRALDHLQHAVLALSAAASPLHLPTLAARVAERRRPLLDWWIRDLVDAGRLQAVGEDSVVWPQLPAPAAPDPAPSGDPLAPWTELIDRCAERLDKVLEDALDPLALFFGEAAESTTRRLYREAHLARLANDQLARVVRQVTAAHPGRALRVLEIGAGTGAAAAVLLPLLPAGSEYLFTDLSAHFFAAARAEFAGFGAIARYQVFDVGASPREQGLDRPFDLVVACNVLHVCTRLDPSLGHLRELLRPDGLALLCEVTAPQAWFDLAFGLLLSQSDWRAADRPRPLLNLAQWRDALARNGLDCVQAYPEDDAAGAALGQHVLVARRTAAEPGDSASPRVTAVEPGLPIESVCVLEWHRREPQGGEPGAADRDWLFWGTPQTPAEDTQASALRSLIRRDGGRLHDDPGSAARSNDGSVLQLVYAGAGSTRPAGSTAGLIRELLAFVRQSRELALDRPLRVWFLSCGAWDDRSAACDGSAALIWGFARAFAAEQPAHWGGVIDLAPAAQPGPQAGAVWRWLRDGAPESSLARVCADAIEVPRLRRATPDDLSETSAAALRAEATYLVTGGWGGLGLQALRYLAARGARRIVLVGRHAPPARTAWPALDAAHPWRARIDAVRDVERLGASVSWQACDVADEAQVAALAGRLADELPALAGVVHCAGAGALAPLDRLSAEAAQAEGAAKCAGTEALLRHLRPLDFMLLCGSLTAWVGAGGLGAYAAANAFMDAVARHAAGADAPAAPGGVRSIQWGVLATGGLLGDATLRSALSERGYGSLTESEVTAGFDAALRSRHPSLVVARMAWARLAAHAARSGQREPVIDDLAGGPPAAPGSPDAGDAARPGVDGISLETVLGVLRQVLDDPSIGPDDDIFSRGADSIMCIDISVQLKQLAAIELPPEDLFAAPSARSILARIAPADAAPAPIVAGSLAGRHGLSYSQQRLWFLDQIHPHHHFYNVPAALEVRGPLDCEALRRTLETVVLRHAVLRSRFSVDDGLPVQQIVPAAPLALPLQDLSAQPPEDAIREAMAQAEAEARIPFDLGRGPLLRARLLRLAPEHHVALVTLHHIASDGWSMGVLSKEVAALYGDFAAGRAPSLPPLPVQYVDYAAWQQRWLTAATLQPQLDFWARSLDGAPVLLALPTDRPRPPAQGYRGARSHFRIEAALAARVQQLGRDCSATLFVVLATALKLLLRAYSGQNDICLGTPVANRGRVEVQELIGFFVNNLVLRTRIDPAASVAETVASVRDFAFEAYARQDVPFERVVERVNPIRSLAHAPIFQVYFILHHAPMGDLQTTGLRLRPLVVEQGSAKFDLTVEMTEVDGRLDGWFEYDVALFDAATVDRMTGHLGRLLEAMVEAPHSAVGALEMTLPAERAVQLEADRAAAPFAAAAAEQPAQRLFERRAASDPARQALVFGRQCLSYAELDDSASRLAAALLRQGIGAECVVAVCQDLAPPLVVSLLAVLKAGAAYLPLDPSHPAERLRYILDDARPGLVLASRRLRPRLPGLDMPVWDVDDLPWRDQPPLAAGALSFDPAQAAYIVYTSGSTGRPKGIVGDHRTLANRLAWMAAAHPGFAGLRFVQKTVIGFIDSITEMLSPLSCGASLCIADDACAADPAALARLMSAQAVQGIVLVPSLLRELLRDADAARALSGLRAIISSGEAMPVELAAQVRSRWPQAALIDCYGSSEVGDASAHVVVADDLARGFVALGPSIDNTRLLVLGESLQPAPLGAQGEIFVAGHAVARAYLGQPAMTAERFLPDPFAAQAGARMFRTGDIGRRLADGGIEFLGRRDHQVKLRGFRVELGEVEAALRAERPGARVAAQVREDAPGDRRLVAYVEAADESFSESALKERLRRFLPTFMVPSHIVRLEHMPMTPNGKIDRLALPAVQAGGQQYAAPVGPTEQALAALWQQVLRVERVGRHDAFFELGGHSLLAAQALALAKASFGVELPMRTVFEAPRLADIAARIDEARAIATGPAPRAVAEPAAMSLDDLAALTDEELDAR